MQCHDAVEWKKLGQINATLLGMSTIGSCEHCGREFSYTLIHNGFNDSASAYCDTCGCAALLSIFTRGPADVVLNHGTISPEIERQLAPCRCGGHFRAKALPRCPHCHLTLSAEKAATYIEANAPGTAKGWRWQRSWRGLYTVIIEEHVIRDPWANP